METVQARICVHLYSTVREEATHRHQGEDGVDGPNSYSGVDRLADTSSLKYIRGVIKNLKDKGRRSISLFDVGPSLNGRMHLSLTALIPENCWEKCIMRATISCCLYVEEHIWEMGKTKEVLKHLGPHVRSNSHGSERVEEASCNILF